MTVFDTSVRTPKAALPPDTDLNAILADLADDHVAVPKGQQSKQEALAAIVDDAREHGIALSIVVVQGNKGREEDMRDLATSVGKTERGTVAVFSDDFVGTYSDAIPRARLEWAEDPSKGKGVGHSDTAARIFVDRLESPQLVSPTTATSAALAVLVLLLAGLYWVKARRARRSPVPPAPAEAAAPGA
ncbi:Rv1476 family membrane protein [Nocardia blacklockiae]|uniref:Rv1476 family membrane protein n=1 Tax=Nocardia blacklockiae TaxID=480036 RepID=UPI0018950B53|nr:DUF6676 family protein [Nocardia blacklockiae]MBF6170920.1 hypothetical protein [Nocardia blacklockiae]